MSASSAMSASYSMSFLVVERSQAAHNLAGAVPGPYLDRGIFRKNASSDLLPDEGAEVTKLNLEYPHSPPPEKGRESALTANRGQVELSVSASQPKYREGEQGWEPQKSWS